MTLDKPFIHPLGQNYSVNTSTAGTLIEQTIDLAGAVQRRVMDTAEDQIRQALIGMGWTPPADTAADQPDWLVIAKAAGKYGIRYSTNRNLLAFVAEAFLGKVPL